MKFARPALHPKQRDSFGYRIPAEMCPSCRANSHQCSGCGGLFTISTAEMSEYFCSQGCQKLWERTQRGGMGKR